jgi:hypothetical protein
MNRVGVALAAAAVVVAAAGVIGLNMLPGRGRPGPSGSAGTGLSEPSATAYASFRNGAAVDPFLYDYSVGRHDETVDGIHFSVNIPGHGWGPVGPNGTPMPVLDGLARISINRSYHGPQGAEATIYWTSPFGALYTDPCQKLLGASADGSIDELASVVAAAPGTNLVTGPSNVTIDGRPAKFLALTVREDMGCNPGYFFSWDQYRGGALWTGTEVGDTIRVWIVEVDGMRLFIAAETHPDAEAAADVDVRVIVGSIQFE